MATANTKKGHVLSRYDLSGPPVSSVEHLRGSLDVHEASDEASLMSGDSTSVGGTDYPQEEKEEKIAQKESNMVLCMRLVLLLVLVSAALLVSLSTFYLLTKDEKDDFEKQFYSDANMILHGIGSSFDETLGAVDSYVSRMAAQTWESDRNFPFVTVPAYGVQASKLLKLSKAHMIWTNYFVTEEQQDEWQEYASQNDGWIQDVTRVMKNDNFPGPPLETYMTHYTIQGRVNATSFGPVNQTLEGRDNYAVFWQASPLIEGYDSNPYNVDAWNGHTAPELEATATSRKVVIARSPNVLMDPNDEQQVQLVELYRGFLRPYASPDQEDSGEPVVGISYPIMTNFDSVSIDITQDLPVHGVVFFSIYFRDLIKNILPDNSIGLVVVIESACGDVLTYQLDGALPIYLGGGDLHDTKYDYLEVSSPLGDIMDTANSGRESSYTGVPLNEEYCFRSFRIYPSQTTEDLLTTNNPMILSVAAALIFVFTSLVFVVYDYLVRRRQRIVKNRAMASSAIVNSLFPKQVAKQLYVERQVQQKRQSNLANFMQEIDKNGSAAAESPAPIASFYDNTTILFADLKGFTKWSSMHTPAEVFLMLETFYGSFDKIAKRRGVFKVETVGDCYVAVTGIPEPRQDHAVCMCKFARDCMVSMEELKVELAEKLGPETLELQFRVGMHSGSVYAGVLRGEKGRFQLFGDTMNTASRMESNGIPGKIQVSQDTADALTEMGKSHWLVAREDKVHAKGKGEMQTYFVEIKRAARTGSSGGWSTDFSNYSEDFCSAQAIPPSVETAQDTIERVEKLVSNPENAGRENAISETEKDTNEQTEKSVANVQSSSREDDEGEPDQWILHRVRL